MFRLLHVWSCCAAVVLPLAVIWAIAIRLAASIRGQVCSVLLLAVVSAIAQGARASSGQPQPEAAAQQILETAAITGGLIVHLGCGDGQLTAALARQAGQGCVVQGLEHDPAALEQARQHIRSLGLYGPVSVAQLAGPRLPYADNLVNLLVVEQLEQTRSVAQVAGGSPPTGSPPEISRAEMLRVLVPGGVACLKQGREWQKIVKPWPSQIDEWTHFLYDASGNAVAHDQVVGPPRELKWTAEPPHMRSHEHIPGLYALVSAGGRIFYILDEAPPAAVRCTPRWRLVARDAFNGVLLWERPLADWYPHIVNWGQTPRQLERKLVAAGERVFVTLGLHAPLSVLDAATGRTLAEYDQTAGTEEILFHAGTLLLVVRSVTPELTAELQRWAVLLQEDDSPLFERERAQPLVERLRQAENSGQLALRALDAVSGRVLWEKTGADAAGLRTMSLCAAGDRVFYQQARDVICLDLGKGEKRWSTPCSPLRMVAGGAVYCTDGQTVTALDAQTGRERWTQPTGLSEVRDVFLAGGSLWLGGFKPFPSKRGPAWGPYFATELDPATGKMLRHIEPENPGHHHRCYQNKATDRYIFAGRRGTELIDLKTGEVLWNSWARGVCRYGVMPCNGLLYAPPHACGCYMNAKLIGFNALAPGAQEVRGTSAPQTNGAAQSSGELAAQDSRAAEPALAAASQPLPAGNAPASATVLQRGPAYADLPDPHSVAPDEAAWPTYRGDARRSGCARRPVGAKLRMIWKTEVGARITPPTIARGKLLVASVDQHRVVALDASGGRQAWDFTAGGRVDSPPTVFAGRAIFGCRDGWVYSLRLSDGVLAWRLPAARASRLIVADGQLESAWPAHGSVLVREGMAYFTAGRSSYLDGGIDLCRVDAVSGENLLRTNIFSPDPQTGRQPPQFGPANMPGTRADLLSADEQRVYLNEMAFDPVALKPAQSAAHLLAMTGFLDDSWPHRSYWIFGTQWSASLGCSVRDKNLVYGRLLVFDDKMIYGFGRDGVHWSNQLQDGPYRLFALARGQSTAQWTARLPIAVRAMVLAGEMLFVAGPADGAGLWPCADSQRPAPQLLAISTADGSVLARYELPGVPIFDGMAAADGRLYISLAGGAVACFAGQ